MHFLLILGLLQACTSSPPDDVPPDDTHPNDTQEPPALDSNCDSGSAAPDPLSLDWRIPEVDPRMEDPLIELLDVEVDLGAGRAYAVGQGGLFVYDLDPPTALGAFPPGGHGRYHHLELLGNDLLALSNRDSGITIVDTSSEPYQEVTSRFLQGAQGMTYVEPYLLVVNAQGSLAVLEINDSNQLTEVEVLEGLASPWNIAIDGSWAYVGLVPIDLSNPENPLLQDAVATAGGAQDLTLANGHAYVATGATGIEVFSLTQPDAPQSIGLIEYGTAIVSVSSDSGLLWGVGHEDLVALDISVPSEPMPLAIESTPQYGMHVTAAGSTAWVADWNLLDQFSIDKTQLAPAADPSPRELFLNRSGSGTITLRNRGASPLLITGAASEDNRLELAIDTIDVIPGDSAILRVSTAPGTEDLNTEICLATNDPNNPRQSIQVTNSKSIGPALAIGEEAPDFVLEDIDGNSLRLSDQLGHPVVLVYFATW